MWRRRAVRLQRKEKQVLAHASRQAADRLHAGRRHMHRAMRVDKGHAGDVTVYIPPCIPSECMQIGAVFLIGACEPTGCMQRSATTARRRQQVAGRQ
eukprot:364168-Chlamydomonas_euryale.AAC.10